MQILVISNYYPPLELGGWEQLTRDVNKLLGERGHQVFVLTSNYQANKVTDAESNVARKLYLESPDHEHYHLSYTLTHRWQEKQNQHSLTQTVTQFKPDVIYINGMWNLPHSVAYWAEQLSPGRVVYYIASTWPTDLNAHKAYWLQPAARSWLNLPKRGAGWVAHKIILPDTPHHQLAFSRVMCVSAFMARYMINKVGVPATQVQVVHNGIDVAQFAWSDRSVNSGRPLQLLYAGGLWEIKGVHTAIESIDYLVNQLDMTNIHLTLVGSGHPGYVRSLKNQIQQCGIERFVTFGERVPRSQMPSLLRQYDVLLFPSTGPEALARMVQEAMACGLMVIGSTTGGTPEILEDEKNGLTFEAGNAPMLADKIAQIAQDPLLYARLARAARQTIEERFTLTRMVDEVEACLTSAINQQGAKTVTTVNGFEPDPKIIHRLCDLEYE